MKLTDFVEFHNRTNFREETVEMAKADLRSMANALRATFGMKKLDPPRPTKGVRWTRRAPGGRLTAGPRGDGYDQQRIDAAVARRERRQVRNLRNYRRGGYVRG